jgi:photosystem II stability/assembly factor-like uncharacterized protein
MTSNRSFKIGFAALLAGVVLTTAEPTSAQQGIDQVLSDALLEGYAWRNIGPDRGGRSIAVSGVRGRPDEGYFGAVGGGLWKTMDGGDNWFSVTDFQITSASVGAVAVSETNPDLVVIGTGETCIRGNILPGDGVYRSRDAGATSCPATVCTVAETPVRRGSTWASRSRTGSARSGFTRRIPT